MICRSRNGRMRKELQKGYLGVRGGGRRETAAQAGPQECSNTPSVPVRVRPVAFARRAVALRFQGGSADRVLRSANHSAPRLNYYLPTLTELEDEVSDDSFISSEEPEDYLPRPHPGPGPEPVSPLQRRLRSYRKAVASPQQLTTVAKLLRQ